MTRTPVMHMADPVRSPKTLCGVEAGPGKSVGYRHAQYVTCKRCLAALHKVGAA